MNLHNIEQTIQRLEICWSTDFKNSPRSPALGESSGLSIFPLSGRDLRVFSLSETCTKTTVRPLFGNSSIRKCQLDSGLLKASLEGFLWRPFGKSFSVKVFR